MILIPVDASERAMTIDWFLEAMNHGRLTIFDADDMLGQLRLAGDVVNLERLSRALAARGCA
ncbi:hypothetical protein [Sphingomonas profundi]|uniref:hypothetical protein n=1 Tax=Alterirhizorhabdus profundi TaxID=2681549 RepID=UPI0012E8E157|nr:hypothetical protein [Sphingomonas profundi]